MEFQEKRKRPLGVSIMAILLGIQGLVELVIAALAIGALVALGHALSVHGHTRVATVVDVLGWVLAGCGRPGLQTQQGATTDGQSALAWFCSIDHVEATWAICSQK